MRQHMNMIWHHAPRQQFIAFVVEMKHRRFGNFCDSGIAQVTFTNSAIQIFLELRAFLAVVRDLQQVLPLAAPRFRH